MNNFNSRLIMIFLTTLACFICVPRSVSGADRRISGLSCVRVEPFILSGVGAAPALSEPADYIDGVIRGAPAGVSGVIIQCPVPDDDVFPKSAVKILQIRGRATGNVRARACSRSLIDNFFSCSDFVTATGRPGVGGEPNFGLIMNDVMLLPAWGREHINDFAYLEIRFEVPPFPIGGLTPRPTEEQLRLNRNENFISGIFLSSVVD